MAAGSVGKYQMEFLLLGKDKATKIIEKVDGKFKKSANQAGKTSSSFNKTGASVDKLTDRILNFIPGGVGMDSALKELSHTGASMSQVFTGVALAVAAVGSALMAFKAQAEEAAALRFKISRLGEGFLETSDQIRKLRRESDGVFSTQQLADFMTLQKELNVDLGLTGDDLAKLDARFTALGRDATSGFKALVEEVKKGGGEQLVALGIVKDLNSEFKKQEKIVGRSLTLQERQAVAIKEVRKGISQIDVGGEAAGITAFEKIAANLSDMAMQFGSMLEPIFRVMDPLIGMVRVLVDLIKPVGEIMLTKWVFKIELVSKAVLSVVQTIGNFLIPFLEFCAHVTGNIFAVAMDNILGLLGKMAPDADTIESSLNSWTERIHETHDGLLEIASMLGLIDVSDARRAINLRKAAKAEEERLQKLSEQESKIKAQRTELERISNFQSGIRKTIEDASSAQIKIEESLLSMRESNGTITSQEERKLKALRTILRIESETAETKLQIANVNKAILDLEKEHAEFVQTGRVDPERSMQLEQDLEKLTAMADKLNKDKLKIAKEASKEPTGGRGAGKSRTFIDDSEEQKKKLKIENQQMLAEGKRLMIAKLRLKQRDIDIQKITETNRLALIELDHKRSLIDADIAEREGKFQLAESIIKAANARKEMAEAAEKEAIANKKAAENTRMFHQSLSVLGSASTHLAGNELATLGVAIGGLSLILDKTKNDQIGVAEAISSSGGVFAAAAAEFGASKRATAALLSAFELAAGFAAIENPIVAAAHFTAAGLFGAVAAGAGTVSGAQEAGPALQRVTSEIDKERDRGDRQITINISGVVTDAQGIGLQIKQALGSMDGTGV
jgi:hypothetical protein